MGTPWRRPGASPRCLPPLQVQGTAPHLPGQLGLEIRQRQQAARPGVKSKQLPQCGPGVDGCGLGGAEGCEDRWGGGFGPVQGEVAAPAPRPRPVSSSPRPPPCPPPTLRPPGPPRSPRHTAPLSLPPHRALFTSRPPVHPSDPTCPRPTALTSHPWSPAIRGAAAPPAVRAVGASGRGPGGRREAYKVGGPRRGPLPLARSEPASRPPAPGAPRDVSGEGAPRAPGSGKRRSAGPAPARSRGRARAPWAPPAGWPPRWRASSSRGGRGGGRGRAGLATPVPAACPPSELPTPAA